MSYFRVNKRCNGCLACVENCPASALSYVDTEGRRTLLHNIISCARCGNCWRICPEDAIEFQHLLEGDWDEVASLDLVHCSVCGEPIYTVDFQKTLKERHDQDVETLCPLHKSVILSSSWYGAVETGKKPGDF